MTVDELRDTLTNTAILLARDIHDLDNQIKAARRQRAERQRELDRQQGALAALGMLDADQDELGAEEADGGEIVE